jgi:hypothetical protein
MTALLALQLVALLGLGAGTVLVIGFLLLVDGSESTGSVSPGRVRPFRPGSDPRFYRRQQ